MKRLKPSKNCLYFEFYIDDIVKIIDRWIQARPMDAMKYRFD